MFMLKTLWSGMISFELFFGCKRNPISQKFGCRWILSVRYLNPVSDSKPVSVYL